MNMALVIGGPMVAAVLAAAGLVGVVSLAGSSAPSGANGTAAQARCVDASTGHSGIAEAQERRDPVVPPVGLSGTQRGT